MMLAVIAGAATPTGPVSVSAQARPPASDLLDAAIEAQGGRARLESVQSVRLDLMGHAFALEQSERPEGPWLTIYRQRVETRDHAQGRRRVETQQRFWSSPRWSATVSSVVAGGVSASTNGQRWAPGRASDVDDARRALALAPEKLLLTARAATDVKTLAGASLHGVPQDVIGFSAEGLRCRLYLDGYTHLPTMLEYVRDDAFGIWGDVTERRWFGYWTLEAGGLLFPRQTSVEWNGVPYTDDTAHAVTVDAPVDDASFVIPDEVADAFEAARGRPSGMASLTLDESRAIEIAPWLVQMPGGFNVALVRQPDGIVVIEGTTSSAYSASVIAAATKRFPGLPIKAVVTTSDAWPHIGGVREYVARGVPVHALDLNVAILSRLVEAPHAQSPDTLETAPRKPEFRPVSRPTTLGSGETRMELIPVRGEMGERMMLIWFPGLDVLYSSDLIQHSGPGPDAPFFMPEMLMEVATAVHREQLTPSRVFGMHLTPTPWTAITAAIDAARRKNDTEERHRESFIHRGTTRTKIP
ncbi:MAG: MBL fold metallo-hydrolase [Vicinamibacterales bacterium]